MADKEYIEREESLKEIDKAFKEYGQHGDILKLFSECRASILLATTADVEEVRHGEWVQIGYDEAMDRITCSCCKEYWNFKDNDTETFNYCPACGAKMDGKDDEA